MLKTRLISALIITAVLATAFFWNGVIGALVFTAVMAVAIYEVFREYSTIAGFLGFRVSRNALRVFGLLLLASVIVPVLCFDGAGGASVLSAGEILVWVVFLMYSCRNVSGSSNYVTGFSNLAVTITGLAVIYGSLSFIPKLYFLEGLNSSGRYLLLFVLAVTKFADIGAYAAGSATARLRGGNHKLSPRLSPKKSWEGLMGGIEMCRFSKSQFEDENRFRVTGRTIRLGWANQTPWEKSGNDFPGRYVPYAYPKVFSIASPITSGRRWL